MAQVDANDVLLLVQQLLSEQGLVNSLTALQKETAVGLNSLTDTRFFEHVRIGKWNEVLSKVLHMKLSYSCLALLYEQIILELLEMKEVDTAMVMAKHARLDPLVKEAEPSKFARLEKLLVRQTNNPSELYATQSKQERRDELVQLLKKEIVHVPNGQLLKMLGQSLKWQQSVGILKSNSTGKIRIIEQLGSSSNVNTDSTDAIPIHKLGTLKFGKASHAEVAKFANDGKSIITGSSEGMVEIWDPTTCKLRKDLSYQYSDDGALLMHRKPVLCLDISSDSEMVASGCQGGKIKVWRITSGQCLRKFSKVHRGGITAICFSPDNTQLASGGDDGIVKVHGLQSGKTLKELRGHESYVNTVCYFVPKVGGGLFLASGSSDGTVKIWNVKTMENVNTIRTPSRNAGEEVTIHQVLVPIVKDVNLSKYYQGKIWVCNRSPNLYLMSVDSTTTNALKTLSIPEKFQKSTNFVSMAISNSGRFVYGIAEDHHMYCFDVMEKRVELQMIQRIKMGDYDVLSIVHHPKENMLATVGAGVGKGVRIWTP